MEVRGGLSTLEVLGHQFVNGDAVLGVHHHQCAGVGGLLHRPQDLAVIGVVDARVRHEQLEAGDPFGHQFAHGREGFVVDIADDLMEPVVDRAVARRFVMPRAEGVLQSLPGCLDGEVDDGGGAAESRCTGTCFEGVRRGGATEWHLHMGVRVHTAGDDVLAGGVDDGVGGGGEIGAERSGARFDERDDRLAVDQHVDELSAGRGHHRAAADECDRHQISCLAALCGRSGSVGPVVAGTRSSTTTVPRHCPIRRITW